MNCESSAVRTSAGASGSRGKHERSASSKHESNCVVHAGRSECCCIVCKSSGGRSTGRFSRKIATYWVRRSCTSSRQVSTYFFMYRAQVSGASNPRLSPSALVNATLSASRRPVRNARASSRSGSTACGSHRSPRRRATSRRARLRLARVGNVRLLVFERRTL